MLVRWRTMIKESPGQKWWRLCFSISLISSPGHHFLYTETSTVDVSHLQFFLINYILSSPYVNCLLGSLHGQRCYSCKQKQTVIKIIHNKQLWFFLSGIRMWKYLKMLKLLNCMHYNEVSLPVHCSSLCVESQRFHLAHIAPFIFIIVWLWLEPKTCISSSQCFLCFSPLWSTNLRSFYFILHLFIVP